MVVFDSDESYVKKRDVAHDEPNHPSYSRILKDRVPLHSGSSLRAADQRQDL